MLCILLQMVQKVCVSKLRIFLRCVLLVASDFVLLGIFCCLSWVASWVLEFVTIAKWMFDVVGVAVSTRNYVCPCRQANTVHRNTLKLVMLGWPILSLVVSINFLLAKIITGFIYFSRCVYVESCRSSVTSCCCLCEVFVFSAFVVN